MTWHDMMTQNIFSMAHFLSARTHQFERLKNCTKKSSVRVSYTVCLLRALRWNSFQSYRRRNDLLCFSLRLLRDELPLFRYTHTHTLTHAAVNATVSMRSQLQPPVWKCCTLHSRIGRLVEWLYLCDSVNFVIFVIVFLLELWEKNEKKIPKKYQKNTKKRKKKIGKKDGKRRSEKKID